MSQPNLFLKVVAITPETPDAITIHLEHPDKIEIPYQAGQFLTLIVPINSKKERRAYSLCSSPAEQPRLSVTVKRVEGGLLSNYLLNKLKVGDTMEVLAPMGNFKFIPDATTGRTVVLIGAGSGITPLLSIAKSALQNENSSRIYLIYGNRNENSVIFKEQLKDLEQQYSERFSVTHIYSQPASGTPAKTSGSFFSKLFGKNKRKETTVVPPDEPLPPYTGRLNRTMLIKILEELQVVNLSDTQYYLCGPEGLMEEAKAALQILHVPAEKVF
ncbi:MAG: FAD-binding oxidoreductase, partial [Bacteroidota bacterium]|nr:FAD-binding oxidoreductase [Bacteroidota bacterium]